MAYRPNNFRLEGFLLVVPGGVPTPVITMPTPVVISVNCLQVWHGGWVVIYSKTKNTIVRAERSGYMSLRLYMCTCKILNSADITWTDDTL